MRVNREHIVMNRLSSMVRAPHHFMANFVCLSREDGLLRGGRWIERLLRTCQVMDVTKRR